MDLVAYRLEHSVATITMDDGKVNALSPEVLAALDGAFDRAEADRAVVVLTGRTGVFSAGFDLEILRGGGAATVDMVRAGFTFATRVLGFPLPVVVACPGHAIAMGAFLLLSGDYLIGVSGSSKLMANEVAIGLQIPRAAVEIVRHRLTPAAADRALNLSEQFSPDNAVEVGFLDRVVAPSELADVARQTALKMTALDLDAHAASKRLTRREMLAALRTSIAEDFGS